MVTTRFMIICSQLPQKVNSGENLKNLNFQPVKPGKQKNLDQENQENPKSWPGKPGKNSLMRIGFLL